MSILSKFLGDAGHAITKGAGDAWNATTKGAGDYWNFTKKAAGDTAHEFGRAQKKPWVQGLEAGALSLVPGGALLDAAIMAGLNTGGSFARGENVGDALKQGGIGALEGGAAGYFGPHNLFGGAGTAAGEVAPTAQSAATTTLHDAGGLLPDASVAAPSITPSVAPAVVQHGALYNAAAGTGSFLKNNAPVVSAGLNAAGEIPQIGSENRLRNAQAASLEQQTQNRIDAAQYNPARLALYGALAKRATTPATHNPYMAARPTVAVGGG